MLGLHGIPENVNSERRQGQHVREQIDGYAGMFMTCNDLLFSNKRAFH